MAKIIILALLCASLLLVGVACASPSPIGVEWYSSELIHAWNQGSIEKHTGFSKYADQMANNEVERFNWTKYEMGLGWNQSGILKTRALNFSEPILESDNLTYWKLGYNVSAKAGGIVASGNYTLWQELYDNYVTMEMNQTICGLASFPYDIFFYRAMIHTDIWNDGLTDHLTVVEGGKVLGGSMDFGRKVDFDDLTRISIKKWNVSGGIEWLLGSSHDGVYLPQDGEVDGWFAFYKIVKAPHPDCIEGSIRHQWIDADPCGVSCAPGCSITGVQTSLAATTLNQSPCVQSWKRTRCRWLYGGGGCGLDGCSVDENCHLMWQTNESVTIWKTVPDETDYDYTVNCHTSPCSTQAPLPLFYYYENVTGWKPTFEQPTTYLRCSLADLFSSTPVNYRIDQCNEQNITLVNPVNYYNLTNPEEQINFNCTREGYWTDSLALYINNTLYRNESSQGFSNLSEIIQLNDTGIYEWDCRSCTYGNCTSPWSWNGNFTIHTMPNITGILISSPDLLEDSNITLYYNASYSNFTTIDWRINDQSPMLINLPFNSELNRTYDYTTHKNKVVTEDNTPLWTEGKIGGAYYFNGVNQGLTGNTAGGASFYNSSFSQFTICFWVKLNMTANQIGHENQLFGISYTGSPWWVVAFRQAYIGRGEEIRMTVINGANTSTSLETALWNLQPNTWYHICGRWNGNITQLFKDGTAYSQNRTVTNLFNHTYRYYAVGYDWSGAKQTNGTIDEVQFWNASLPDDYIKYIYDQQSNNQTINILHNSLLEAGDCVYAQATAQTLVQDYYSQDSTVLCLIQSLYTPGVFRYFFIDRSVWR